MITIPRYIQLGTIRRPLVEGRVGEAIALDYMGSAEFEFGALPTSLREMQSRKDSMSCTTEPRIMGGESSLRVLHSFSPEEYEEYVVHLLNLRADKVNTKEVTRFGAQYKTEFSKTDFWWDIRNNVMWSFDKVFMKRLPTILQASWNYMDEQKGKQ